MHQILDGHFSHYFCCKFCIFFCFFSYFILFVWRRPKINEKEIKDRPFLKMHKSYKKENVKVKYQLGLSSHKMESDEVYAVD